LEHKEFTSRDEKCEDEGRERWHSWGKMGRRKWVQVSSESNW